MATTYSPLVKLRTIVRRSLADTLTPVSIYLKVRDHFQQPVLLESNDFRSAENCFSYIALDPIATFRVEQQTISREYPGGEVRYDQATEAGSVARIFQEFIRQFAVEKQPANGLLNGFLGYTAFESAQYFDTLQFDPARPGQGIPLMQYSLYRYIIGIDHFREEMFLLENLAEGQEESLESLENLLKNQSIATYPFRLRGEESSNLTDDGFRELVSIGKSHCRRGDVFQIVFSRQFQQAFQGDDFNVYRVLRSVNPSPYLFYFDFGGYKIFGSSPEAQLVIQDGVARVNPIAGTYRRTGRDTEDRHRAKELAADPKENAEHTMLVDLARNDLGRHAKEVEVKKLKEIQYFSHVIHLVSTVEGKLTEEVNPIQVFGDTFPAGTLSGAPKYRAMELINRYENQERGFYGGGIGFVDFEGNLNHAIVIRSFLSMHNHLYYQAGAGIVAASEEEKELQEVNNKLGALKKALVEAEKLS